MRSNLAGIKARVDRVAESVRYGDCSVCQGRPVDSKTSFAWVTDEDGHRTEDEPDPWPTPDMPKQCVCGREIEYTHVIVRIGWTRAVEAA